MFHALLYDNKISMVPHVYWYTEMEQVLFQSLFLRNIRRNGCRLWLLIVTNHHWLSFYMILLPNHIDLSTSAGAVFPFFSFFQLQKVYNQ